MACRLQVVRCDWNPVGFPHGMDFAEPDELWKKYVQSRLFQPDLPQKRPMSTLTCLLYTSDAADE